MDEIPTWMKDHEVRDEDRFNSQDKRFDAQDTMLAQIQETMKSLATEKSIRDLVHEQKNILAAAQREANLIRAGELIEKYGKKGYSALLILAAIVGALGVILGGGKVIFAYFFTSKI